MRGSRSLRTMRSVPAISRRMALKDMGKAGLALIVFGAACTDESGSVTTINDQSPTTRPTTPTSLQETTTSTAGTSTTFGGSGADWARVNMGFVSAYILYRNEEAALVDTGQAGAENDINAALQAVDLGWDAVTSVIVTHRHGDHVGSLDAVAGLATNANIYGGEGDIASFGSFEGQGPVAVGDDDNVFGLDIIETPGHTPGHISVLDSVAGILVTGDALNRNGGTVNSASADPRFTADLAQADDSVRKLAGFDFEVVLFGHGEPIESGGAAEVGALAEGLS